MTLFLTSSPCTDNVLQDPSFICEYNPDNEFVENLRAACPEEGIRLVMVAAWPESPRNDEMLSTFVNCFERCGIPCNSAVMLDARNASLAPRLISESDFIILSGGHVPTEIAFFESLHLKALLEGYEGTVMGISAGSMNAAEIVYAQPEEPGESIDPNYRRYFPGLGLTKLQILPHYQKTKGYWLDGKRLYDDITFTDSMGHCYLILPDGSYVLSKNGCETLYGEAWLLRNGNLEKICENGGVLCLD